MVESQSVEELFCANEDEIDFATADIDKECRKAAKVFCTIYCSFQDEHDYDTCMDGFLWYDGCVKKVTNICKKNCKQRGKDKAAAASKLESGSNSSAVGSVVRGAESTVSGDTDTIDLPLTEFGF